MTTTNQPRRLTREQAEKLADELLANAPRVRDTPMARAGRAWQSCAVRGWVGTYQVAPTSFVPFGYLNTFLHCRR